MRTPASPPPTYAIDLAKMNRPGKGIVGSKSIRRGSTWRDTSSEHNCTKKIVSTKNSNRDLSLLHPERNR